MDKVGHPRTQRPAVATQETGIRVEKTRLRKEMSRQAASTVTTHHVHLFSVELTIEEMDVARKCAEERTMFGNAAETEQTYIETITLREAIPASKLDFNTLGMIMQSIGIFYDNMQAKEDQQMAERLMRLGLAAGTLSTHFYYVGHTYHHSA